MRPNEGRTMPQTLTDSDYKSAALWLGVPVAAIKAVASVESAGSGFLPDGRPKILFERHVMFRQVSSKLGRAKAEAFAKANPSLVNETAGGYLGDAKEHDRLGQAANLDRDCALQSASWGKFQIMGYHWKALGYESLQAFINAMYKSEGEQLDAFSRFIKVDSRLHQALKALDWKTFASIYNGPGYAKNQYDKKMSDAYKRAGGVA